MMKVERVRYASLKAFVTRLITHPFISRAIGFTFKDRIPSFKIRIATTSYVTDTIKAMIFWRIYESAEIRFVKQYLRQDVDVVELGSSIGVVSSHIAKHLGAGRKLICVEGNPNLASVLSLNLAINAQHLDFCILPSVIDYTKRPNERIEFYVGATNISSSLTGRGECIQVPSTTLSLVLAEQKLQDYSLVMDIEGAELGILLHDKEPLKLAKQIIAELHSVTHQGVNYSVNDLVEAIEKAGFALTARRGPVCVFCRCQ